MSRRRFRRRRNGCARKIKYAVLTRSTKLAGGLVSLTGPVRSAVNTLTVSSGGFGMLV